MYRIFDILISSNIPIPELPETSSGSAALQFLSGSEFTSSQNEPNWFHHWYWSGSQISYSCARTDDGYLLRYPGLADFLISIDDNSIVAHPVPGTPRDTLRHLLLDNVIPNILGHQGRLVLHASSVELKDGTGIAFLGSSGWGKSTIASSFAKNGARLLTDDCLLVDIRDGKAVVIPSYMGVRLLPDSANEIFPDEPDFTRVTHYSEKQKLIPNEQTDDSPGIELNAIFLLDDPSERSPSNEIKIKRAEGADSIMTIIKRAFLIDVHDMDAVSRIFTTASRIASSSLDIYTLSHPREYDRLADLRHAVISTVERKHMP